MDKLIQLSESVYDPRGESSTSSPGTKLRGQDDKIGEAGLQGVTQIDQERIKNPLKKNAYLQDLRYRSDGSRDRIEYLFLLNLSLMETKLRTWRAFKKFCPRSLLVCYSVTAPYPADTTPLRYVCLSVCLFFMAT